MLSTVALRVFRGGAQELEIAFQYVFDPQKNVTESRLVHQGSKCLTMGGNGRGHGLDKVVQLVQTSVDDGMAKGLETMYVERNVVVHQENGTGTVVSCVSDVSQDAFESVGVKVASAHFDDRAETTVVGATARGLDHIDLASEERIALEHAGFTIGQADLIVFQPMYLPPGVVEPPIAGAVRKAGDPTEIPTLLQGTQKFAKRDLAFATHDEIHIHSFVGFAGKTRVVTAHHDFHSGFERTHQIDDAPSSPALEGHRGKPDHLRIELIHQPGDRVPHLTMAENQIGNRNLVVGIDVSCERGQSSVRHANGDRGHVLEIVWHGE